VPQRTDPGVVACTFILSGMRLFDIRDPYNPKEIAYFNGPIQPTSRTTGPGSAYAMAAPTLVPERGEVWYSDGNSGFYAVKITNGVWPFAVGAAADTTAPGGGVANAAVAAGTRAAPGSLPATGGEEGSALALVLLPVVLLLRRLRTRSAVR
jgi:hypothetical protein